ncbi:MAG TPA: Tad domain-containing protein [Verrucomicrobiae bacterium]|jgi:hypothetical protein|nr:Tad domain-containing protein [Verrucomicrobiae bacterium]
MNRDTVFQKGQMLPLMAILLTVLMGFTALAVDVGYQRYQQQIQQSATDSAAIAGASELSYSSALSDITSMADADAIANGFTANSTTTIAVNNPPASGDHTTNNHAVQVIITTTRPTAFESVLGRGSNQLRTTATAAVGSNGSGCIYALSPTATTQVNSGTIYAPTCGMMVDGNFTDNSASITMSSIGVVGKITANSPTYGEATPMNTAIPISDPCTSLVGCAYLKNNVPATSPCNYTNYTANSVTVTLQPGVYCGGIVLNSSTVTMSPGLYVVNGSFTDNSSNISGSGVTIYQASGAVTLNSGHLNMTAPLSGNTEGVLFYQPAANASAPTFNSATATIQGILYFPSARFTLNSGSNLSVMIIASTLTMNSGTFSMPGGPAFPGGPQNAQLVDD